MGTELQGLGDNPFLSVGKLPDFPALTPEGAVPAVRAALTTAAAGLEALERQAMPTWDGLMAPLAALEAPLDYAWNLVAHHLGVLNSPAWREAHDAVQPEVVAFGLRLGQSRPLLAAYEALRDGPEWAALSPVRRRIVEAAIRAARLAGVGLAPDARTRFNAIRCELAELGTTFSNHVLDATKAFALRLVDPADVEGLPASLLSVTAQAARAAGDAGATAEAGPWRITLDFAVFGPFMAYSRRRELRERLYRAQITRAAAEPYDNAPLLDRILELRGELARLLGYRTYAEVSLVDKMAPDVATVDTLLRQLRDAAWNPARRDFAALVAAAEGAAPADGDVRHWDVAFWSERLREQRFAFNAEDLRPYFAFPRVLEGLFALTRRLFGVVVAPADGEAPVWHPDVRFYRVQDLQGRPLAAFYLDPYSRPASKQGGAWMNPALPRMRLADGTLALPAAYLVCNQMPPVGGQPSLLTFREVQTLFHEFGHGLQHMLTTVDEAGASGIRNVEWDAVEIASQFMENWLYHGPTLQGLTAHVTTGLPLPDELLARVLAARTFQGGWQMLRQVYQSMLDIELHHRYRPGAHESLEDVQRRVAEVATILRPLPEDRFLCAFSHIFAGGYAAGYYSYKWSEVLASDAFAAFEEAGLDDPHALAATGQRYRDTLLALGGGAHPREVFRRFRGRDARPDALLRHCGLLAGS